MTRGMLAVALLLVPTLLPARQGGAITIRLSPTPNQIVRTHTSQEMTMTSEQEAPADQATSPQILHSTMTTDSTMTVGPSNEQGRYEARVVLDSMESTSTMNGQPMASPKLDAARLAFTTSYDEHGNAIDMTGDSAAGNDAAAAIRQMIAMSTREPLRLAVGESVTVPNQLKIPLPGGASSAGGGAMTTTGETKYTLSSITVDGDDRIAHLATKRTATTSRTPGDADTVQFTLEQHMSGDGTIDVNIDRGVTIHSSERIDMDGKSRFVMRGSPERLVRNHGTTTFISDLVK